MLLFCNEDKEQMTDNYCPPSILFYPLLSSIIFFLLEKIDLAKVEVFNIYISMSRVKRLFFQCFGENNIDVVANNRRYERTCVAVCVYDEQIAVLCGYKTECLIYALL